MLGITTVGGNVGLRETTRNALRVLALLGRTDVPVAAGAAAPLMRPLEIADDVHGESGLDGADLPEPASDVRPEGALAFLRATLEAAPEPVTLIPTGPLTNIAQLLLAAPALAPKIAHTASWAAPCARGTGRPPPSSTSGRTRRPRGSCSGAGCRSRWSAST